MKKNAQYEWHQIAQEASQNVTIDMTQCTQQVTLIKMLIGSSKL